MPSTVPTPEDLEDTAELPGLPAADSPTDTWVAPQFSGARALDDILRVHQEELGSLRSNLASVTESRGHLELDLRSLTTNLRELETRLHSKSEQLSRYERDVGARDRRIAEVDQDLATRTEQLKLVSAEGDELRTQIARVQAELAGFKQQRERQVLVQTEVERDRVRRAAAFADLQAQLAELQRRVARHNEALQHAEGRRYLFDAMLREREQLLDERDAGLAALRSEFEDHKRARVATQEQLASELETAKANAAYTERTLAQLHDDLTAQRALVEQAHANLQAQQAAAREQRLHDVAAAQALASDAEARCTELERQLADQGEGVRSFHEQLRIAQGINETLRGDLAAAEDLIRTSESELQQREARLARLESNELALRSKLEAVGRSLDERNALVVRLEAEAASSAAVLGSIQNNLQTMSENFARTGDYSSTGTKIALNASGARPIADGQTRLLVRTEGDVGIVHVLGRRTTVGRTPDNDLRIDADFISRHHAVLLVTARGTIVEDLNSTNGVFVNHTRVTRRTINEGDLVMFGKSGFRYILKPTSEPA